MQVGCINSCLVSSRFNKVINCERRAFSETKNAEVIFNTSRFLFEYFFCKLSTCKMCLYFFQYNIYVDFYYSAFATAFNNFRYLHESFFVCILFKYKIRELDTVVQALIQYSSMFSVPSRLILHTIMFYDLFVCIKNRACNFAHNHHRWWWLRWWTSAVAAVRCCICLMSCLCVI